MREWTIPFNAPLCLTLAVDTRFAGFNPQDDQVWELQLSEGEPRGVCVRTTYGLRAKGMRILPAFEFQGEIRHDPATFQSPPLIHTWLPTYVSASWQPFAQFEVTAEYWVRTSNLLAGRFTFLNLTEQPIQTGLRLYSILEPGEDGQPMTSQVENGVAILAGQAVDLRPIVFIEGGARSEPAPYPAVGVQTIIPPGSKHSWLWAHCGLESVESGFVRCREIAESNWDAEVARLQLDYSDLVEVETGDLEWDAAFWAAQREAHLAFLRPHRRLKAAVPVCSRSIKDGSTSWGTGFPWEPASPWEAYYAALQILPTASWRVSGMLETLLRLQEANGHIPVFTDFGAIHDGWLYPPLLAQLTWRVHESTGEIDLLEASYSSLQAFFETWFQGEHDRDEDGFPEWDHVHQAGFKTWPLFSPWYSWAQGLDVSKSETVDLASQLILEGEALLRIASVLDIRDGIDSIQGRLELLRERVEASWNRKQGYQHVDYYLHESVRGKRLAARRGSFTLEVDKVFDPPARVLVKVEGPVEKGRDLRLLIHSRGRRGPGRIEELNFRKFNWFLDLGFATSEKPSAEIEKIELQGLDNKFKTTLSVADYSRQDLTLALPLAAGVPSPGRAGLLVNDILFNTDLYWRANGLVDIPFVDPMFKSDLEGAGGAINLLLNHWVGEGLLRYGYRRETAELIERLMKPVTHALRTQHAFSPRYDPDGDKLSHERGGFAGLAPLALLLEALGVELITPRKLRILPGSPFGQPVRLRWRGLEVACEPERTVVTFPDGEIVEVRGEREQLIEQVD